MFTVSFQSLIDLATSMGGIPWQRNRVDGAKRYLAYVKQTYRENKLSASAKEAVEIAIEDLKREKLILKCLLNDKREAARLRKEEKKHE
jgi:hypothetical protein